MQYGATLGHGAVRGPGATKRDLNGSYVKWS